MGCDTVCDPVDNLTSDVGASSSTYWLVKGSAHGSLLHSDEGLSFWGGTNASTGEIIDRHHPLSGEKLDGRILAIPSGRGSCSGSLALLELLVQGCGPSAIILERPDEILALGGLVAGTIFGVHIPLLVLNTHHFSKLRTGSNVIINEDTSNIDIKFPGQSFQLHITDRPASFDRSTLSISDVEMLEGKRGESAKQAMEIILSMAELYGATELIDVTRAHIDSCIYTGPASLRFARHFRDLGAKFAVPTTLNSISVDQERWKELGVNEDIAEKSNALAGAYLDMGASPQSLTCAPYLLSDAPKEGDQIVWGESNAVVYANSVLGARTQKYPDLLEVSIALTGRAPLAGCHLEANRRPTMRFDVAPDLREVTDPSFWVLLGYHVGSLAGKQIPIVTGLESSQPRQSDLKAFGAAFATTSASPMFHIRGITPEADHHHRLNSDLDLDSPIWQTRTTSVQSSHLLTSWNKLNSARSSSVGLVALGNPHLTLDEFQQLASLVTSRTKLPNVSMVITSGREVFRKAEKLGYVETLRSFGAELLNDTCWCMLGAPVVGEGIENLMTNSGKYAHYAPGIAGKNVHFGNLKECVEAACRGEREVGTLPAFLQ